VKSTSFKRLKLVGLAVFLITLVLSSSCLPQQSSDSGGSGGINITLYGFSIMKESLEKAIYPAFKEKWKREH
jgi:hypothetical protein